MAGPAPKQAQPEVQTYDSLDVQACASGGLNHDWRPHTYQRFGRPHISWRCVWCHAVACGNYGEPDPCWLTYHHQGPHRSRAGTSWPLGEDRSDPHA